MWLGLLTAPWPGAGHGSFESRGDFTIVEVEPVLLGRGPPGRLGRRARARFVPDRVSVDGNRRGSTSTLARASAQLRGGLPGSPGPAGTSRGLVREGVEAGGCRGPPR